MKIQVHNPDEELSLRVFTRSTANGNDGAFVDIAPGETAEVEITNEHHGIAIPIGTSNPSEGASPVSPVLINKGDADGGEKRTLIDADDATVTEILTAMRADKTNLTKSGMAELPEVNKRLDEGGFNRIDAGRRDSLWSLLPPEAPAT